MNKNEKLLYISICCLQFKQIAHILYCKFNHTEIYICISFITIDLLYFTLLFNELHFLVWSDECLIDNNADE